MHQTHQLVLVVLFLDGLLCLVHGSSLKTQQWTRHAEAALAESSPTPYCPSVDVYPNQPPLWPNLPPLNTIPYKQRSYLTASITTFAGMMDLFQLTQITTYNEWINAARSRYQQNGYYIDPTKVPYGSYPVAYPTSCYNCLYYPNGYSVYGYDQQGYDPNGYTEGGYGKDGYSRQGREDGSQYNSLCQFQNPLYANQYCIMDNYGKPYTSPNGVILRYTPTGYGDYAYDQYGNDQYGNPKPKPCPPTGGDGSTPEPTTNPPTGTPPQPPTSYIPINDTVLGCVTRSEETQQDGSIIYIRKSTGAMTVEDWTRFKAAWNQLNDNGVIEKYRVIHAGTWGHHHQTRFLPWHREFVARLEDELHRVDKCVFLPYWDIVANPAFPAGIAAGGGFPPDVKTVNNVGAVTATTGVTRNIGAGPALPNAGMVNAALANGVFTTFTQLLEQVHDQTHVYVGGSMGSITAAPRDPVFYMHHANVDRLWWQWQPGHAGQPTAAVIAGMAPIRFAAGDTVTYAQEVDIGKVKTVRGAGYKYI